MTKIAQTVKTAISLPREDFQLVEQIRRESGKTRSQVFLEAFRLWVRQRKTEQLERQYSEAYARMPEQVCDNDPLYKAGLESWEKDSW
jgi:metal-responsive CopG/Arc/MetJ family transcriptional regulator